MKYCAIFRDKFDHLLTKLLIISLFFGLGISNVVITDANSFTKVKKLFVQFRSPKANRTMQVTSPEVELQTVSTIQEPSEETRPVREEGDLSPKKHSLAGGRTDDIVHYGTANEKVEIIDEPEAATLFKANAARKRARSERERSLVYTGCSFAALNFFLGSVLPIAGALALSEVASEDNHQYDPVPLGTALFSLGGFHLLLGTSTLLAMGCCRCN